ncbi:MAG: M23 family metallopeptidase [Deltaproteobacteria bacterium]|nr:M23 family metallopeptidase [Deltaproteobacteria bacterium]
MHRFLRKVAVFGIMVLFTVCVVVFLKYFEGEKPSLLFSAQPRALGKSTPLMLKAIDRKSGLKSVAISLVQNGKDHEIMKEEFPGRGLKEQQYSLTIDVRKLGLRDGTADLVVKLRDHSLRKNETTIQTSVLIDTVPPRIDFPQSVHYATPGGACLIIFTISEETPKPTITVNGESFTVVQGTSSDKPFYFSYLAMPHDASREPVVLVASEDLAGNQAVRSPRISLRQKKFKHDAMGVSDTFLNLKMPEFQAVNAEIREKDAIDAFIYVNETLRRKNNEEIRNICRQSDTVQFWTEAFDRLDGSAAMSTFGDRRTYFYKSKKVGSSIHLGIDLASTQNAPVPAANTGIVIFTDFLGIYGNTVIIDHGQGISSLYSHLSSIVVSKSQRVTKGAVIGHTGMSGLAGGDHLHFSMLVDGRFVDPKEWWDRHWIYGNITKKFESVAKPAGPPQKS